MDIDDFFNALHAKVMDEDHAMQIEALSVISGQRKIPEEWLLEHGIMFIPNNEYVTYFMGEQAYSEEFGFYLDGRSLWTLMFVIPVRSLDGRVVGFTAWDAYNKYQEQYESAEGLTMYKVSGKYIFNRSDYFLTVPEVVRENFNKSTVFVVDGVFDSLVLNYLGIPCIGLFGSTVSNCVAYFLKWFEKVLVIKDNDDAGNKLYERIRMKVPQARAVIQTKAKDIEEYVRDDERRSQVVLALHEIIESRSWKDDLWLSPRKSTYQQ